MDTVTLIFILILFVCTLVTSFVSDYRAKKTTYHQLLNKSYELIDKGQFNKLRAYLQARSKLVLLHYNELIPLLTEHARKRFGNEINKSNKEV